MIPRQLGRVLWIGAHQSTHSGKDYLTFERVEGQKVYGRREITGRHKITLTKEK
jgi:hypothetical protein